MDPTKIEPYKNALGYHLYGDIKHDFGNLVTPAKFYNYNGEGALGKVGVEKNDEDSVVSFFTSGAGKQFVNQYDARKGGEIVFTIPDKTANFQNWIAPLLYPGGNDKIGVIQDAGEFITQRLGAKNVITFGSILDPAGKPIAKTQEPIWYNPPGAKGTVTIPLMAYGFDPAIISDLQISKLTAGTVNASYIVGSSTIDAVAMSPPAAAVPGGKGKRINKTEVEFSGFFTSIDKVSKIDEQLSSAGITDPAAKKKLKNESLVYFYIGKTLGDASLVASGLPDFYSADMKTKITNPFYGLSDKPNWKSWVNTNETVDAPTILALKTGDRLNYVRAMIMDLPVIYEQQAKGGKLKEYVFFPGIGDPKKVRDSILSEFSKLREEIVGRYNDLRLDLLDLIKPDRVGTDVLPGEKTSFAPGGQKEIRTEIAKKLAAKLIKEVADLLIKDEGEDIIVGVCATIATWLDGRKNTARAETDNDRLRKYYEETLRITAACLPQSTYIYGGKNEQEKFLLSKLVVANVPNEAEGWPLPSSLDISLRNAFSNFNSAKSEAEYEQRLARTDIMNRFLSRLRPPQAGGMIGGVRDDAPLDFTSTVNEVVGDIEEAGEGSGTGDIPEDTWNYVVDEEGIEMYVSTSDPSDILEVNEDPSGNVFYYSMKTGTSIRTPPWENPQSGGDRNMRVTFEKIVDDDESMEQVLGSFPRIRDFIEYMKSKNVLDRQFHFLTVFDVVRRRNTDRIFDNFLAVELKGEFVKMLGLNVGGYIGTKYITVRDGNGGDLDLSIFGKEYVFGEKDGFSNTPTLLYNAYVASIDAENSLYGDVINNEVNEVQTQSVIDFKALEKSFLDKIPTRPSRSKPGVGTPRFQGFPEKPIPRVARPAGGSHSRRPLY